MGRPSNIVVLHPAYRVLSDHFYRHQVRLGYATSRTRQQCLNEFLQWLEQRGHTNIFTVTPRQIKAYYAYLSERPNKTTAGALNAKTTYSHMRVIRDLFVLLQHEGQLRSNPCSTLRFAYPRETTPRYVPTQVEINALYQACVTAQERAMLSMAYGCGLRAGELTACNREDIRLRDRVLIVPRGKGNKRRVVPLSASVAQHLADYYYQERPMLAQGRDYRDASAFMLHLRGGRMQDYTYNKYLKRLVDRSTITDAADKPITLHCLRHAIATHLLQAGLPVEQVRQFLGHSQLETTQGYTHVSAQQLHPLIL